MSRPMVPVPGPVLCLVFALALALVGRAGVDGDALRSECVQHHGGEFGIVMGEALAAKGLDGYFRLAEQYHTQSEPTFCGLGSLVVALNALGIDPKRSWKGPWRWFSEDLLDCCLPLAAVREQGLTLDEVACLARCNGGDVELERASPSNLEHWRAALALAASGEAVVIAAYDRAALGQTGSGHFSPIGGYHAGKNLALVLDVARFKYPAHWMDADRLWQAMQEVDAATKQARGWMVIRPSATRSATCSKG